MLEFYYSKEDVHGHSHGNCLRPWKIYKAGIVHRCEWNLSPTLFLVGLNSSILMVIQQT